MDHGKQIRLFLTDGSATGVRYAELMNWTGQAFACPRSLFTKLKNWPETQRAGVYVLVGLNEKGEDAVYIGESENVLTRLLSHVRESTLDDIVEAFFFTSKDDNLTKGHITYLEQRLIQRAEQAKRYVSENVQKPSEKTLPKMELGPMEEFLEKFYLVAAVLGCEVFKTASSKLSPDSAGLFKLAVKVKGIAAIGYPSEEGFVVQAGSTATLTDAPSLHAGYKAQKADLKSKSVLVTEGDRLKFTQDFPFKSSSAAACVVAGAPKAGPTSWVRDGKTLREVEAEKARADEKEVAATPTGQQG
jgi:hypothetical protein